MSVLVSSRQPFDITIIIPTFNRMWALPRAIESCFANGCSTSTEVIVIDDGSTDGTWEWLQKQKAVTSICTPNWGKDRAVNAGMAAAQGEYIRFLDSDDWLEPRANAEQLAEGRKLHADIVVAGYRDYFEISDRLELNTWVDCDDFVAQQLGEVSFSHYSAFLFRKAFIKDIPHRQEFALRDDRMFVLEAAIKGPRLAIYSKPAFVHRHHMRARLQRTTGFRRDLADWTTIQVYRKAIGLLQMRGELTERRQRAAMSQVWPAVRNLARSQLDDAAEAAQWIWTLDPAFIPPARLPILWAYRKLGFRTTERLMRLYYVFRRSPPTGPPI